MATCEVFLRKYQQTSSSRRLLICSKFKFEHELTTTFTHAHTPPVTVRTPVSVRRHQIFEIFQTARAARFPSRPATGYVCCLFCFLSRALVAEWAEGHDLCVMLVGASGLPGGSPSFAVRALTLPRTSRHRRRSGRSRVALGPRNTADRLRVWVAPLSLPPA